MLRILSPKKYSGLKKYNLLKTRAEQFKNMFKNVFNQGLPNFWDEEGIMVAKNEYLAKLQEKKDDTSSIDKMDPIIKGHHIFEVLDREFFLFYETRKIITSLASPSYNLYSNLDVVNQDLLAAAFPVSSVWQRISQFSNKWILSNPKKHLQLFLSMTAGHRKFITCFKCL